MANNQRRSERLSKTKEDNTAKPLATPETTTASKRARSNTVVTKNEKTKKPKVQLEEGTHDLDKAQLLEDNYYMRNEKPRKLRKKLEKTDQQLPAVPTKSKHQAATLAKNAALLKQQKMLADEIANLEKRRENILVDLDLQQEEKQRRTEEAVISTLDEFTKHRTTNTSASSKPPQPNDLHVPMDVDDPHSSLNTDGDLVTRGVSKSDDSSSESESESSSEESESTEGGANSSGSASEEPEDEIVTIPSGTKAKTKARRGETRQRMEVMKRDRKGKQEGDGGKKKKDSKKSKKSNGIMKRPDHLMGIHPGWDIEAHPPGSVKRRSTSGKYEEVEVIGGFQDKDVASAPPTSNTFKPRSAHAPGRAASIIVIEDSDTDTKSTGNKKKKAKNGKSNPNSLQRQVKTEEFNPTGLVGQYTNGVSDTIQLPDFIQPHWTTKVLPLIYHRFLSEREDVFLAYAKGCPQFLERLNEVITAFAPNNTYQPSSASKIVAKAYDRINEKRSAFGSEAIAVVERFFAVAPFKGNPDLIVRYSKWALRANGPAFWANPTPRECLLKVDQAGYIKPDGRFGSTFIVETAAPSLKCLRDSTAHFGKPVGGMALAAIAVERAFQRYIDNDGIVNNDTKLGDITPIPPLSHQKYGEKVGRVLKGAAQMSDNRWGVIEMAIDAVNGPTKASKLGPSRPQIDDDNYDELCQPSSPPAAN